VAALEPLDAADPFDATLWIVIRGTLREGDLLPFLDGSVSLDRPDVTLDLQDAEDLTPGGCWALRKLGDDLWAAGRRLTVVFGSDGPIHEALRASGTTAHPRIRFQVVERPDPSA
jgi:hypothetical protein